MSKSSQRRGFNSIELMVVLVMAGVLLAIGLPRYFRAQTHALQSEAVTNLKSLHASLIVQQNKPYNIHVHGFDPPRGNRYSYHLDHSCAGGYEDRSNVDAIQNDSDECIGVDVFAHMSFPSTFPVTPLPSASWDSQATWVGLGTSAGLYEIACGYPYWDYLAYASGDTDDILHTGTGMDTADTWAIASADGWLESVCPANATYVPAGEPFMVVDDAECN